MIFEKIVSRRTIRKYLQKDVPKEVLISCVDAARLSPSGANRQPLKYVIIDDKNLLKEVLCGGGIANDLFNSRYTTRAALENRLNRYA